MKTKPSKIPEPEWMRLVVAESEWFMEMKKRIKNTKRISEYLEEMKKTIRIVGN